MGSFTLNPGECQRAATRRAGRSWRILLGCLLVIAVVGHLVPGRGQTYLDLGREWGPAPHTGTERLSFAIPKGGVRLRYDVRGKLPGGSAGVTLRGPDGTPLLAVSGSDFTLAGPRADQAPVAGDYTLEVTASQAVGSVRVAVYDRNRRAGPDLGRAATGKLMILVGTLAIWLCRRQLGAGWKYFLTGGALWAGAVALKFACALLLNAPLFAFLRSTFSPGVSTVLSALYIGLLTSVFEIGLVILAVRRWPGLAGRAAPSIAIGVGAGAAEAILLGLVVLVPAMFWPAGPQGAAVDGTRLAILVPVIERTLALVCHAASRAAVFFAAATGRMRWAVAGFALLTGVDMLAGAFLLQKSPTSIWLLELALVPFAVVSIVLLVVMVRRWPENVPAEAQGAAVAISTAS